MAMIVELFGPPGSGKTTFAKALAARLRDSGSDVRLHLSSRPGEDAEDGPAATGFGRIARPLWELVTTAAAGEASAGTAGWERLSPFLARVGPVRRMRLRQYQSRLAAAWARAKAKPGVVIFDQGYLQLAATVLALRGRAEAGDARAAIEGLPACDLALSLEAAPEELATRLNDRFARIGVLGRLLEAGGGRGETYVAVCRLVQEALVEEGRATLTTRSSAGEGFAQEVERAAQLVQRSLRRPRRIYA